MESRHNFLAARRQKSLAELEKSARQHRGVKAAREAAMRDTRLLLQEEVRARTNAKGRTTKARKEQADRPPAPDMFQGLH